MKTRKRKLLKTLFLRRMSKSPVRVIQQSYTELEILNNEILADVQFSISSIKLKCIIDSAAELSIIKPDKILKAKINKSKRMKIIGVAKDQSLTSLGTVRAELNFNGIMIEHEFHVVNSNLNLARDAVIGNDILIKTHASIDYFNETLKIRITSDDGIKTPRVEKLNAFKKVSLFSSAGSITKPILKMGKNILQDDSYQKAVNEYFSIENEKSIFMINKYKTKNEHFYEELPAGFSDSFKKCDSTVTGVFNSGPLCSRETKFCTINTITQTENEITDKTERLNQIMNKIDLEHLDKELQNSTCNILYDLSDAFYINGDVLRPITAYTHSIRLKPQIDTFHTKQYRIPESHKMEIERQLADLEKSK